MSNGYSNYWSGFTQLIPEGGLDGYDLLDWSDSRDLTDNSHENHDNTVPSGPEAVAGTRLPSQTQQPTTFRHSDHSTWNQIEYLENEPLEDSDVLSIFGDAGLDFPPYTEQHPALASEYTDPSPPLRAGSRERSSSSIGGRADVQERDSNMASFGRRGSGQGQRHWQPPHMVNSNGAGGVVDLTSSPPGLSRRRLSQQRRPRKRSAEGTSPQEGEQEDAAESSQRKRQRRELRDRAAELFGEANTEDEEDGAPGAQEELQQTELQQAVSNQQHEDSSSNNGRPLKIGQRTCIICMENYTDATVTACGHIYCHECLMKSLHHSAKTNNRNTGNCPACRKSIFITGKRKDTQIIPIAFMKKEVFKGRRR